MNTFSSDAEVFHKQSLGAPPVWQPSVGWLIVDFVRGFIHPEIFVGYNTLKTAKNTGAVLNAFRAWQLPSCTLLCFTRPTRSLVIGAATTSGYARLVQSTVQAAHEASLRDTGMKYAEVTDSQSLLACLTKA